jgi:hypothetical protein
VVIVVVALLGADPLLSLFYWGGTGGGLGILLLLALTSAGVLGYFAAHPHRESAWRRRITQVLALLALAGINYLVLANLPKLLGAAPGSALP